MAVASLLGAATLPLGSLQAANDAYAIDATSGLFSNSFTLGVTVPAAGGTAAPLTGDALFFGTETTGTTAITNDLTGFAFVGLTFNALASSFVISGNDFSLGGPILNNSQSQQTINNNIALTAASTFTTASNGGNLVLNGALSGAGAITFAGRVSPRSPGTTAVIPGPRCSMERATSCASPTATRWARARSTWRRVLPSSNSLAALLSATTSPRSAAAPRPSCGTSRGSIPTPALSPRRRLVAAPTSNPPVVF